MNMQECIAQGEQYVMNTYMLFLISMAILSLDEQIV